MECFNFYLYKYKVTFWFTLGPTYSLLLILSSIFLGDSLMDQWDLTCIMDLFMDSLEVFGDSSIFTSSWSCVHVIITLGGSSMALGDLGGLCTTQSGNVEATTCYLIP